jgi:thioredoxin-related protein
MKTLKEDPLLLQIRKRGRQMILTRRKIIHMLGGMSALALAGTGPSFVKAKEAELTIGDDGLYHQDWFVESFLDLRDDIREAADSGKHFAVLWEQRGCPYCREMHRVNFANPRIRAYIKANFNILQLDLWGPRKVTDFDGKEMGERELARRWRVNFTPTMNFFPRDAALVSGKTGVEAELIRMPGYFKPFHFLSMFEYVRSGRTKELGFQRFIQEKGDRIRKEGKTLDLWKDK